MKNKYEKFGNILWQSLTSVPFGSISKRELEILLLQSAISSNLIHDLLKFLKLSKMDKTIKRRNYIYE